MATSGHFNGSSSGSQPYLQLYWDVNETDVRNNRTRIRLRLYLNAPSRVNFSASKTGAIEGHSFTYTGGMSGTGTRLLRTQYIWINHNNSGVGSRSVSAYFNIDISFSGWMGRISVSGTVNPPDIKRLSNFTSARTTEPLKPSGGGRLELTVTDRPAGYWQWVGIYDGGTEIHNWGYNQSTPTWWSITSTIAKKMLDRMSNTDSKVFTVRVYTYTGNGTGNLGYQSQNIGVTVDSNEVPTKTSFSQTQAGSGWDSSKNLYIQNHSRLLTSFKSSAPYGTSIVSESVTIDGKNYTGNGPITSDVIKNSGWVSVVYHARDARGRGYNDGERIWVEPYEAPKITKFTAERRSSSQSIVDVYRSGSWNTLNGNNSLNIKIQRSLSNSSIWSTIEDTNADDGSFGSSVSDTGRSISSGYEYKITITDDLGNTAERAVSVSTAKVLMNFNQDIGVGIGKMHERGELDVAGDVYFEGNIELRPKTTSGRPGFKMISQDASGHAYIEFESAVDGRRKAYLGIPNSTTSWFHIANEKGGPVNLAGTDARVNGEIIVESGSNSNGNWVKLYDGTMIAWYGSTTKSHAITSAWGSVYYGPTESWTYPTKFSSSPRVFAEYNKYSGDAWVIPGGGNKSITNSGGFYLLRPTSATVQGNIDYLAIGRWY